MSKKISQLEQLVDQRLIQRTTRKLSLTESGENLFEISGNLLPLLESVEDYISDNQSTPKGRVKVSCSTLFGQNYLLPELGYLREAFPDIQLELNFDDSNVDLIEEGIDIAIRIGHLPDSPMLARKIGEKRMCFVASPDYLSRASSPSHPRELTAHQCLIFKSRTSHFDCWQFADEDGKLESIRVDSSICCNDARALVTMLKSGLGIAMIDPHFISQELSSGELVEILSDYTSGQSVPIQLLCLGRATRSKASKAIWESLAQSLPKYFDQKKRSQ